MDRDLGVALARAALGGDALAMSELLDHLAGYVGRICGPIALDGGPDAAQEALIAVFRGLRSLREPEALYGWVRAIAVREAVRVARRQA
jgi:RNA polymerase sigma-70 factor (ECF subfamily)